MSRADTVSAQSAKPRPCKKSCGQTPKSRLSRRNRRSFVCVPSHARPHPGVDLPHPVAMHGTSRLYKPPPDTLERRTARESARSDAQASARYYAQMRSAGMSTSIQDNRFLKAGVRAMGERSVMGHSSLRSFGSNAWAPRATETAPRLASTNQMTYGFVGVPPWKEDIGKTYVEAQQNTAPIWLGTRYARPMSAPPKPRPVKPVDPRLQKWRGMPPPPRSNNAPKQRPASNFTSKFAADTKEVKELLEMGIGSARNRKSSTMESGPKAVPSSYPAKSTYSVLARSVPMALAQHGVERRPGPLPSDDLSWVAGPWGVAGKFLERPERPKSAPQPVSRGNPVPSLSFEELLGTSVSRVNARKAAPIGPSG